MELIADRAELADALGNAEQQHAAQAAQHQRARQAAKRGLFWLGLVYLGFLCGSVGLAVDQIARPFGG